MPRPTQRAHSCHPPRPRRAHAGREQAELILHRLSPGWLLSFLSQMLALSLSHNGKGLVDGIPALPQFFNFGKGAVGICEFRDRYCLFSGTYLVPGPARCTRGISGLVNGWMR